MIRVFVRVICYIIVYWDCICILLFLLVVVMVNVFVLFLKVLDLCEVNVSGLLLWNFNVLVMFVFVVNV